MTTLHALREMADRNSDIGDISRVLCSMDRNSIVFAMSQDLYTWVREIADSAPPRVKFGMLAQLKLPRPVVFIELPSQEGGTAIYAEAKDDTIVASRICCDDEDIWVGPLFATFNLPAEPQDFDWAQADAPSWQRDPTIDARWVDWANRHVAARVRPNGEPPDRKTTDEMFRTLLVPDLLAIASLLLPTARQFLALSLPDGPVVEIGRRRSDREVAP